MDALCTPVEFKFAETGAPGEFTGYASVFGVIDSHADVVLPGAFTRTLAERKAAGRGLPPMYMQHGAGRGADPRPVGVWTGIEEDERGLKVAGKLIGLDTEIGRYNLAQVRDGAMRGLSIGYRVPQGGASYGSKPGEARRSIKHLQLTEVSIVDEPSNVQATIDGLKSRWGSDAALTADAIKSADDLALFVEQNIRLIAGSIATKGWKAAIREFEGLMLRDEAGYSHARAEAIAREGFKSTAPEDVFAEALKESFGRLADVFRVNPPSA